MEDHLRPFILTGDESQIDRLSKKFKDDISTRITVIMPDGKVVGDTLENPRYMDNHANRPEVQTALKDGIGYATRFSGTLQQEMMYVARPMKDQNKIKAIIRTSVAITSLEKKLDIIQLDRIIWGVLTAIIASIICLIISRRISQPIEEMKEGARHFAKGDLQYRLSPPDILEFASLAESMNKMAADLEGRIVIIANQRNEYEAVLSSMVEGVIAVDQNENILNVNQAAARMLNINTEGLRRSSIQEMIRNSKMQAYIADTLKNGRLNVDDITVAQRNVEVVFNFRSMPLYDASEQQMGALAVLNDVTRLRLLETMRSDFVANVSHELKTPLTTIKGFVETIIQNSVADNPEEVDRFLQIILKNVDRLNMIIEDLLSLARIEKLTGNDTGIVNQPYQIGKMIEAAVQVVQVMADKKSIEIKLTNTDSLSVDCDHALLEQALINLLENAIKYSSDNSTIKIGYGIANGETYISVIDDGPGIHSQHIPRLFERFYRADRARSRELGGTGLGLAIVKHIAQLHSGRVTVDSTLGKGSTFTIHLPR